MKSSIVVMAALLGTLFLGPSACGKKPEKAADGKAAPPQVSGVTVAPVVEQDVPDVMEMVGTVKARTSSTVSARIPGTVTVLKVREGDRVKKGQLLAQLESQESAAGAAGAEAAIEEASRGVEEAQTRKKLADVTLDRYGKLFSGQAVTRQELDVKQTERDVATQVLARAEARLKQAKESSRSATAVAGYARITSPLTGIVTARHADRGATVFPGQPLLTIEGEGGYRLELAAPESLRTRLRTGIKLDIIVDGAAATKGTISEIVPIVDASSRTFTVKIDLPGSGFRSGMFGRAQLALGSGKGILVPVASIREQGNLTSVWVVDSGNLAHMRLVKTGKRVGDRVEIVAGLSVGEHVITGGTEKITEGAAIQGPLQN